MPEKQGKSCIFTTMTMADLQAENAAQKQEILALRQDLEYQKFVIAKLQKMLFGPSSERFVPEQNNGQISLFAESDPTPGPTEEQVEKQTITYQRNKPAKPGSKGGREPLPPELPRIEITIEPKKEKIEGMVRIGQEITEILDIIPPVFQVIRIIRPKYARPQTGQEDIPNPVIIAPLPSRPIDKGIPSARLLTYILVSKFMDHLPYYRQIKMFHRIQVSISAKTINGWIARVCVLLKPLYDAFCKHHFSRNYLQADETTIRVLKVKKKRKKGKSHKGYYWVYYAPIDNQVVFLFDPGRGRVYARQHLQGFCGKLQADGLSVYDAFDKVEGIRLFGCMAHVRRKFVDALKNDKVRAEKALTFIQPLYEIERKAREEKYSPAQRLELRQQKAAPIMKQLKSWLDQQYDSREVLPKSAIGIAVRYGLGQWKKVERYLHDGQVEIDNNLVENAIRPVALGRKNYLFAGSEQGARWGAMIYTLLGSAIRHGHNPSEYLADVLRRLPETKLSELPQLFPMNWQKRPPSDWDLI